MVKEVFLMHENINIFIEHMVLKINSIYDFSTRIEHEMVPSSAFQFSS